MHEINDFILLHTNICSLNANLENLETLISNLEFSLTVIAVPETWRATKTSMGTEDHQLRMVVVSMFRKVLSLNHKKILILLIMIQIMNAYLD